MTKCQLCNKTGTERVVQIHPAPMRPNGLEAWYSKAVLCDDHYYSLPLDYAERRKILGVLDG